MRDVHSACSLTVYSSLISLTEYYTWCLALQTLVARATVAGQCTATLPVCVSLSAPVSPDGEMESRLALLCLLSSLITPTVRGWRLYTQCARAHCHPANDRETEYEFDQPTQIFLDQELADQLQQSHRQAGLVLPP